MAILNTFLLPGVGPIQVIMNSFANIYLQVPINL
jgi:hypothetical protein